MLDAVEVFATATLEADSQEGKYLTFRLGNEAFGFEIKYIKEIIGNQAVTPIPDAPAFVKGLINLRGKVLPVMDLRLRFGMPPAVSGPRTCFIVFEVNQIQVGLMVDEVSEVLEISPEQVEKPQHIKRGPAQNFVGGMAKLDGLVVVILNLEELLRLEP